MSCVHKIHCAHSCIRAGIQTTPSRQQFLTGSRGATEPQHKMSPTRLHGKPSVACFFLFFSCFIFIRWRGVFGTAWISDARSHANIRTRRASNHSLATLSNTECALREPDGNDVIPTHSKTFWCRRWWLNAKRNSEYVPASVNFFPER